MLKAAVPSPTATSVRRGPRSPEHRPAKPSRSRRRRGTLVDAWAGAASCFHSAMTFSTIVTTAAPWMTWISRIWLKLASNRPNSERTDRPCRQQHDVEKRDDAGPRFRRGKIGRESQAGGLRRVQTDADQQERQRSAADADPGRTLAVAGQQDQRERHDREAAELQQRAEPDERHPAPAKCRAMSIRAVADESAERSEQQRQRNHERPRPRSARRVRRS